MSIKGASRGVDHAVKVAGGKYKVQFAPEFRIGPGTIIGRQLLQADLAVEQVEQIASEITQHVVRAIHRRRQGRSPVGAATG